MQQNVTRKKTFVIPLDFVLLLLLNANDLELSVEKRTKHATYMYYGICLSNAAIHQSVQYEHVYIILYIYLLCVIIRWITFTLTFPHSSSRPPSHFECVFVCIRRIQNKAVLFVAPQKVHFESGECGLVNKSQIKRQHRYTLTMITVCAGEKPRKSFNEQNNGTKHTHTQIEVHTVAHPFDFRTSTLSAHHSVCAANDITVFSPPMPFLSVLVLNAV